MAPERVTNENADTDIMVNRLYCTRKIELHRKGNKSLTVSDNSDIVRLAAKFLSTNKGEKSPLW